MKQTTWKSIIAVLVCAITLTQCGYKVTEKSYRKVATDPEVTEKKLNYLSGFVARYYPGSTKLIPGKPVRVTPPPPDTSANAILRDELARMRVDSSSLARLKTIVDSLTKLPPPKAETVYITDTLEKESAAAVATINDQRHQIAGLKGQIDEEINRTKAAKIAERQAEEKLKDRLAKEWIHWVIMIGEGLLILLLLYLSIRSFGGIKLK